MIWKRLYTLFQCDRACMASVASAIQAKSAVNRNIYTFDFNFVCSSKVKKRQQQFEKASAKAKVKQNAWMAAMLEADDAKAKHNGILMQLQAMCT